MSLLEKIKNKEFTVGVVGLGYVGLPLAVEFAKNGIDVWGIDVDSRKIDSLKLGVNYIQDLNNEEVNQVLKSKNYKLQQIFQFALTVM